MFDFGLMLFIFNSLLFCFAKILVFKLLINYVFLFCLKKIIYMLFAYYYCFVFNFTALIF
ncbi:hypothetical protein BBB03_01315 [Candidatus Portiera aleyrodidarum]|nr:hypothetical protein BBB03_01315 [Candidatus Portiera aleyrodidarum]